MNLYLLTRSDDGSDYDIYDSVVVAAVSAARARLIHPMGEAPKSSGGGWVPAEQVVVKYLGKAKRGTKSGVVLASYNAG
jgi:hypothetical protein